MTFFGTYLSGKYKKYYFSLFYLSKKKKKRGLKPKGKKTQRGIISFLLFCLLEPEQTAYILNWIQPETSFLIKCVLGRKNCFISTNPAGLPGGPPTLSTSIAFICWPTEDHQNEVFPFLHISKSTGKIAVKRARMKEMANKHHRWSCVTFRNYCRLPVLKTVSSAIMSLTLTCSEQIGLCDCYHML